MIYGTWFNTRILETENVHLDNRDRQALKIEKSEIKVTYLAK